MAHQDSINDIHWSSILHVRRSSEMFGEVSILLAEEKINLFSSRNSLPTVRK
jgi:hypothetical protein